MYFLSHGWRIEMPEQPNPIHEAIESYWGERCPEHEDGCPVCEVWKQYYELLNPKPTNMLERRLGGVLLDEADAMRNFGATANL
jgi:hypothetical protein